MPLPKSCTAPNVIDFIHAHQADAVVLGKQIDVPAEFLLGLSGWESTWGANRFATEGNNFFSLHGSATAPFANGSIKGRLPPYVSLSTFPSYLACGQSFLAQYGSFLRGAKSSLAFAQALIKSGFNSGDAKTGGNRRRI
jgi:hypothetical protein